MNKISGLKTELIALVVTILLFGYGGLCAKDNNYSRWKSVAVGNGYSIAIKTDPAGAGQPPVGTLWAWGNNESGQLGLGDNNIRYAPIRVGIDKNWQAVAASCVANYTLALKTDPAGAGLWAWGYNSDGQLGLGDRVERNTPTRVGIDTNWKTVACGWRHALAIKADGTLWAWGNNESGQLGLGDDTNERLSPVRIGTDTDWKIIASGDSYNLALKNNGTLWAWGARSYRDEHNTENIITSTLPTQIGVDTDWQIITAGLDHFLAIKSNGTLWVWGANWSGQLGLADSTYRIFPTQVGIDTSWKAIAGGVSSTLTLKTDPAGAGLWAWGNNESGQLGLGDINNRYIPILVRGGSPLKVGIDTGWQTIITGQWHTLAIKTDGTLWAWGYNYYGQLGLGDTANRTIPTLLGQ